MRAGSLFCCCSCCCCCRCFTSPHGKVIAHTSPPVGSFESSTVTCEVAVGSLEPTAPVKDLPAGEGWQPVLLLLLLLLLLRLLLLLLQQQ